MDQEIKKLNQKAEQYSKHINKVLEEVKKIIVGQEEILDKFQDLQKL